MPHVWSGPAGCYVAIVMTFGQLVIGTIACTVFVLSLMRQAASLKLLSSCRGGWHVSEIRLQPLSIYVSSEGCQVLAHCQYKS